MSRAAHRLLALASLIALNSACAARMEVPAELASAERLSVEKRSGMGTVRELRFGAFEVLDVERSWTRGSGVGAGTGRVEASRNAARQSYAFGFGAAGSEPTRVDCEATAAREAVGVRSVEMETAARRDLSCAPQGGSSWRLMLTANGNEHPVGTLAAGTRRYHVQGLGKGGHLVPAMTSGFEIRRDGRVVAAVQTAGRSSVWLGRDLDDPDRAQVAAAISALLLFERIEAD
jgi:hypothetical protein